MKKILAFGGSNSRRSINKQLADWAASQLSGTQTTLLDLNDFDIPVFSVDRQREGGFPEPVSRFKELVKSHDAILLSLAEHNGAYSAAFKNIFDWVSRMEGTVWEGRPIFLMATSPGKRGGASVLDIAAKRFPFNGGKVVATFSLPSFNENFSPDSGILDEALRKTFEEQAGLFMEVLKG